MNNKQAKEKLIKLYGAECFIDKLHLRVDDKPRRYKGKAQMKRMKSPHKRKKKWWKSNYREWCNIKCRKSRVV